MSTLDIINRWIDNVNQRIREHKNQIGPVYIEDVKPKIPPMQRGIRHDVKFKVRGRPIYSSILFIFWFKEDNNTIEIEWGGKGHMYNNEKELDQILTNIFNDEIVKRSIAQLKDFAHAGDREGVVRTIDPQTLAANDFMVQIPDDQFEIIEQAQNEGSEQEFRIIVRESEIRKLPGRFFPDLADANQYKYIDVQGFIGSITKIKKVKNGIEITFKPWILE